MIAREKHIEAYGTTNEILITMINSFGKEGGFDRILERLEDHDQNPVSINILESIVISLARCHGLYYRKFAKAYSPRFITACLSCIKETTPENFKLLNSDKLKRILENLDLLAKRCMTLGQKYEVQTL